MSVMRFQTSVTVTSGAPLKTVFETIADLPAHLVWSGERASDDSFKLLSMEAPDGAARVGTAFSSTGANFNGTFHDRSVVTEATPFSRFVIQTESRLDRKRGKAWQVQFIHRYDIEPDGDGSRITYTDTAHEMNYVPYWLKAPLRWVTRAAIRKGDTQQLTNLARLAEERS
jgi:hypothetical protein